MTTLRVRVGASLFFCICIVVYMWLQFTCKGYRCISVPDRHWTLAETYEDTNTSWRGLMRSGDLMLRMYIIHNVASTQSEEITTIHTASLLGMYDISLSPYPGAISQTIRCDDSFKPNIAKITSDSGQVITYYSGLLNARQQYGACVENQIVYRGFAGMLYCDRLKKWAQIELIVPKDSSWSQEDGMKFIRGIACKK